MRLEILGDASNTSKDTIFQYRLDDAKAKYLTLVYPFNHTITELPNEKAQLWQVKCAIELYNAKESEYFNASKYSENGLSITFARAGISQDLINELPPPKAGVPIIETTESTETAETTEDTEE